MDVSSTLDYYSIPLFFKVVFFRLKSYEASPVTPDGRQKCPNSKVPSGQVRSKFGVGVTRMESHWGVTHDVTYDEGSALPKDLPEVTTRST